jgi:helicase
VFRDEHGRYRLTTLGLAATRAVLPLGVASGFAQLLRDLMSVDPTDQLLVGWRHLDTLIVLELLFDRGPKLRRFSSALPKQVDAWMNAEPNRGSLLHKEWIAGARGTSGASEVLGSLGVRSASVVGKNEELARKEAYSAILRATILYELGEGLSAGELERRWSLTNLAGIEERWRDERLWLLAGLAEILDLRCFYFHLREECEGDRERIKRVKKLLLRMRAQVFELRERLKYCSPLGPILRDVRQTQFANGRTIGVQSIRRLEEAGIRNLDDLARLQVTDLIELGVRRDFAEQIRDYLASPLKQP